MTVETINSSDIIPLHIMFSFVMDVVFAVVGLIHTEAKPLTT